MWLKKIAPKSLYARFLLIIILPIALMQTIIIYAFYERHWDSMSRNMAASLGGEIGLLVNGLERIDHAEYDSIFIAAKEFMSLNITFEENTVLPEENKETLLHPLKDKYSLLSEVLEDHFDYPFSIHPMGGKHINIRIAFDGGTLDIIASKKRLASPSTNIFILWLIASSLLFLTISILFLKNQVRSIVRLTQAVEQFGKGHDIPDFKPQGAKEVRRAALTFIEMKERIKRLLTRRTEMLAGVSHDLRTPITRMRLQVEMLKDGEEKNQLLSDINEMEKMLKGYLDFARGTSQEAVSPIKLKQFMKDLTSRSHYSDVSIKSTIQKETEIPAKPEALRRCMTNLLENSARYAKHIKISDKALDDHHIEIIIDDDGCGIPEDKRSDVFQPFYRIEHSRNQETGGVGLGLAIVRDIVHSHGGEVVLSDSPMGGLRVTITLPY